MMGWKKYKNTEDFIGWRNTKDNNLTFELVSFASQDMNDDTNGWGYGFSAIDGKGRENSPEIFNTKKEGKKYALEWMKQHPNG